MSMDKYKYHPEYDGSQPEQDNKDQKKKRAGLIAKAVLAIAGLGTSIGAGHELGSYMGHAHQPEADRAESTKSYDSSEQQPEQPVVTEAEPDAPLENLPVTVFSKGIKEHNGKSYIELAAKIGDETYGGDVPIMIDSDKVEGDVAEEKLVRTIDGDNFEVTLLTVTGKDGAISKIALFDTGKGLDVMLSETNAEGKMVNAKNVELSPDLSFPLPNQEKS
jgi:hypothetical protein